MFDVLSSRKRLAPLVRSVEVSPGATAACKRPRTAKERNAGGLGRAVMSDPSPYAQIFGPVTVVTLLLCIGRTLYICLHSLSHSQEAAVFERNCQIPPDRFQ